MIQAASIQLIRAILGRVAELAKGGGSCSAANPQALLPQLGGA